MGRKPNKMYINIKQQAYTHRKYVGGVPVSRITQFVMGNKIEKFPMKLVLIVKESCQIRRLALEFACIAGYLTSVLAARDKIRRLVFEYE